MKKQVKTNLLILLGLLVSIFVCMMFADFIQKDFGNVVVTTESFEIEGKGTITYKLYKPKNVSESNKAPGVLLLHGYQNDKETNAAYAIELARRGYVAMSIDEYGHGSSSISLINRGYVNHKVTVNYGLDSIEDKTFVEIGGAKRYKVMMNFSNLSFFDDKYTKDSDGNILTDSSNGGNAAYLILASLDYVDDTKLAITGHSMGTWAAWSVAGNYSNATNEEGLDISPKAVVLQCGELFSKDAYDETTIKFNNVLLLNSKYDEFNYFRDYQNTVSDELMKTPLRKEFLGITEDGKWNTTYGSFVDGSARRIELLMTNHRLATHNKKGLAVALDWFDSALSHTSIIANNNQTFLVKEYLVFLSMLLGIVMIIVVINLVLELKFFSDVVVGVPNRDNKIKSTKKWWISAAITMALATFTYPFMTQLGHGLLPLPEKVFRMTIGNGFLSWYLILILIMLAFTIVGYKKSKKTDSPVDFYDLGLASEEKANKLDWKLMGKSALVALIGIVSFYIVLAICQGLFQLDFRFIWPFFKMFSFARLGQFFVYIPIFALFFLLNNSKIFASMRVKEANSKGFKAFMSCWWRYALLMVGGILIIILIEYIPFFLGFGPGADLLFGSTFGGPFMSLLIVFAPQVIVFSLLCTYTYRKTGNVYVGAFLVASLACWIVTGGSAML